MLYMSNLDEQLRIFEAWAPPASRWSPWAKPVLFVQNPPRGEATPLALHVDPAVLEAVTSATKGAALVIDLPGVEAIALALALAKHDFRPVPLYNCTRGPGVHVVLVEDIMRAFVERAEEVRKLPIRDDAPPAFLIDAARLRGFPVEKLYDNRWLVFPQDFPSARAFRESGISRVVVVRHGDTVEHDLRAVLRGWQRDGMQIGLFDLHRGELREPTYALSWFASLGDSIRLAFHGLRVNSAGGFGGVVPTIETSGGYA